MRTLNLPLPANAEAALGRPARTYFALADSLSALADFAQAKGRQNGHGDWSGNKTLTEACTACRTGDLSLVARSDSLLARFERFTFATPAKAWRRDVSGHRPDVPALLAGHPAAMRRRVRLVTEAAPLAVIVDLTTSGSIDPADIEKRGAAILALCRILAGRRPVELWAGVMTQAFGREGVALFARIDTAPLDLARAAFAMVSPAYPRQMLYSLARGAYDFGGSWPYKSHNISRDYLADIMRPALPHIGEVLAIPAAHTNDAIHKAPEAWLESTLARLDGTGQAAA
jgi:hypothetical protein